MTQRDYLKYAAILLILVGIGLFLYSSPMPALHNEAEYTAKYMSLESGEDEKFAELRAAYLTPKYKLQDYGMTAIALGIVIYILNIKGGLQIRTPKNKSNVVVIGLVGNTILSLNLAGMVYLDFQRGGFPHWADSIVLGYFIIALTFLIVSLYLAAHCVFLRSCFVTDVVIANVNWRHANLWLALQVGFMVLALSYDVIEGAGFAILGEGFLLYFFLTLLSGRAEYKQSQVELVHEHT